MGFFGVLLCVMVKCSYSPPQWRNIQPPHGAQTQKKTTVWSTTAVKTWKIITLEHHSGYSSMSQYCQQCALSFLTSLKSCFLSCCFFFYQKVFFFFFQLLDDPEIPLLFHCWNSKCQECNCDEIFVPHVHLFPSALHTLSQ